MGFDQKQNKRVYRFDGLARGEATTHFVVSADMSLFLANHIAIQEGPSLCALKITAGPGSPEEHVFEYELTGDDLRAHAAARALADARKAETRRAGQRRRNS
jgi:hypothetical protein